MSDWISVEDRLPDDGDIVLTYRNTGCVRIVSAEFDSDTDIHGPHFWFERIGDSWDIQDVTHWMPLPEPPQ